MKKLLLSMIALMGFAGSAHAASAQATNEVLITTHTCYAVSISSDFAAAGAEATALINVAASARMTFVAVQNQDAALNLVCSERISMTATGAQRGFKVTPGQTVVWTLKPGIPWYCLNDGTAGTTDAVVCRGR